MQTKERLGVTSPAFLFTLGDLKAFFLTTQTLLGEFIYSNTVALPLKKVRLNFDNFLLASIVDSLCSGHPHEDII